MQVVNEGLYGSKEAAGVDGLVPRSEMFVDHALDLKECHGELIFIFNND